MQPFPICVHYNRSVWLVYPRDRSRARKIAAFRDWLLECVAADASIDHYAAQAPQQSG